MRLRRRLAKANLQAGIIDVDPGEQTALADIEQYGCHIVHVLAEGTLPPFSYSVGIQRSSGAPELIAIGLKRPLAHFILNEYNRRVRSGERFGAGQLASGYPTTAGVWPWDSEADEEFRAWQPLLETPEDHGAR